MSSSTNVQTNPLAAAATPMTIGKQEAGVNYTKRTAVRAVLQNLETEKIAIIHIEKGNYYKLPGGGVDPGEDHGTAMVRELLEETGCTIVTAIDTCFAKCEEFRNDLHQMSFCYEAAVIEDTGRRAITDQEEAEGLTHEWVSLDEALELMENAKPTSELGKFITQRDLFFLQKFAAANSTWGNKIRRLKAQGFKELLPRRASTGL